MQIMKYDMYTCNVYIVYHFYFPETFLQVKKLMEKHIVKLNKICLKKQGKGQIMLHLPMKFENRAMNRDKSDKKLHGIFPN